MASIWSRPQWVDTCTRGPRYHSLQSLIIIFRNILHDLDRLLDDIGYSLTLQWCHYERDGVSNHQPHDCLLNSWFRRRSKKALKLRITGLCAGNSPVTGEFPAQRDSDAENVSIWWCHHQNRRSGHSITMFCRNNLSVSGPSFPASRTSGAEFTNLD